MQEKRIGEYRVTEEVLGKGAFSTVYSGYSRSHYKMAVKVIPRHNIRENELSYFEREINLLRKCKNDWIVDFVDVKKSKSNFYIFLEYCEGGNLAEYISCQKNKRLPEVEALRLFGQLVRGMSCMKSLSIIHRDLKPANIMLKNGNIKIVDFGLARKFFSGELMKTYAGSPLNMAPQILKAQPYSQKVDVYSAGTILYQMLYGVCPFEAGCREELIRVIDQGTTIGNEKIPVSDKVVEVLKQMLQPSPSKRIELGALMDFVQDYERQQQRERIQRYKAMASASANHCGVFGAVISPFLNLRAKATVRQDSPINLDMKMCAKLFQELNSC